MQHSINHPAKELILIGTISESHVNFRNKVCQLFLPNNLKALIYGAITRLFPVVSLLSEMIVQFHLNL